MTSKIQGLPESIKGTSSLTNSTPHMQYLSLDMLREKMGKRSRSSIYRDFANGNLPKPIKIGAKLYWVEAEIDAIMLKQSNEMRLA